MSEPIKVGDLVILMRSCCGKHVGKVYVVGEISMSRRDGIKCSKCGFSSTPMLFAYNVDPDANPHHAPIAWLKRIPPLEELEGEREWIYIKSPEDIPA